MAKIAVDVVLLPDTSMARKAMRINGMLRKAHKKNILLDGKRCIPHMSLCMGCIDEKDMPAIKEEIKRIAGEFPKFRLDAKGLGAPATPTGGTITVINVGKTSGLQKLHVVVMGRLWKYLSYNAKRSMFFEPGEIEGKTIVWLKDYAKHHDSPKIFNPHITVGFGKPVQMPHAKFRAPRLALCRLGNNCTCRKVIASFRLA